MFPIDVLTFDQARVMPDGVKATPMIHGIEERYVAVGFSDGVPIFVVADEDLEWVEAKAHECVREAVIMLARQGLSLDEDQARRLVDSAFDNVDVTALYVMADDARKDKDSGRKDD